MPFFVSRKKFESELAQRTTEACDQIISEMGAEIHDDLIQKLSIFRLYIDRIERSANDHMEVESLAIKMRTDFEQVVRSVKSISRRLLPARIEGDTLVNTLSVLCQNMEHPGTGHIHFESNGKAEPVPHTMEMHIFRIVQELIHNAFKHSAAWHVWVRLFWEEHKIRVEVEDDGSGFARVDEFISRLRKKNNTLKMRSTMIGATIDYEQGSKGLLAKLSVPKN